MKESDSNWLHGLWMKKLIREEKENPNIEEEIFKKLQLVEQKGQGLAGKAESLQIFNRSSIFSNKAINILDESHGIRSWSWEGRYVN